MMLQFITDGPAETLHSQCRQAIEGGVKWIQLRMKGATADEIRDMALSIKPLCQANKVTFIINDNPEVAVEVGADGVHLGKHDMSPELARTMLGPAAIIGATANSMDDVRRAASCPIDYIGLGPVNFTGTKKNLAPVMGLDGISEILTTMRHERIDIPVVAIGGITPDQIAPLISAGADGVAVSGAIAHASDVAAAAGRFVEIINSINCIRE